MANYLRITKCRICKYNELTSIGSLGKIAVSDFTNKPVQGVKMPLELVFCPKCTLVQLAHNFNRDLLYKDYWYRSGLNKAIVEDLKGIAKLCKGSVISIGENDGTLLKYVKSSLKIAVEPSNIKPQYGFWVQDYWENVQLLFTKWDTIVAIACLYDLQNPNKFIKNVKRHLAKEGVFISQFQPLSPMVELNDVGNICHEHLEYYSYKSLVYLFEQNGLEIFKVEKNTMNGGSYRVFARHFQTGSIRFREKEYGEKQLKAFFNRIEQNKQDFIHFGKNATGMIYGYGASTKMGTITQYYGITPAYIIDVNPDKLGKYTNTGALVIDSIPRNARYLWVFPYGFLAYFKQKEKGYTGKWVTTIPTFHVS